jgi:phenylalanyl-tRNA synthetase beta chain
LTHEKHWSGKSRAVDVYDVKADLCAILELWGVSLSKIQWETKDLPSWMHPGRSVWIQQGPKNKLALLGELHPEILKNFDLAGPVVVGECFIERLPLKTAGRSNVGLSLSVFQPVWRDFAFLVDQEVPAQKLMQVIQKTNPLIADIQLFDVFQGNGIPDDKKSMALSVRLEPTERTLTEEDLNTFMQAVIQSVQKEVGGVLRS